MGLGDRSGSHDDHEPGVDGREGEEGLLVPEATHGTHGHLHVAYDDEELKEEHPPFNAELHAAVFCTAEKLDVLVQALWTFKAGIIAAITRLSFRAGILRGGNACQPQNPENKEQDEEHDVACSGESCWMPQRLAWW
eukprot:CAMPEP_0202353120 /NCGR_PEP_ID=MMETSP1126-20121109/9019_1 /ASSEMBLY_ACC=CAM_ASM_000457 /TAXON_ID=3047 /ORGANISM="Dunaliella tertiolecta, Strain CCMP1320" /LENGTH=136 /DNA_ID=CAMNT_0048945427 /DNA_START=991 /DNA_END=1401 /DNA_ORIENTATION=-